MAGKYVKSRKITSLSSFEKSDSDFYMIRWFGSWSLQNKDFLEHWQYIVLKKLVYEGNVYEAVFQDEGTEYTTEGNE